jgi:predicted GNAT family acetyltransferase
MAFDIRNNEEASRFESTLGGEVGYAAYELQEGQITFTHTIVPDPIEHRGLGSALVKHGLDYARAQGLKVVPQCSFVKSYIDKHPEYADLTG